MDITAAPSLRQLTVRDIAINRPGSTAVFRRFKIDYCCGGEASLEAAAIKRGVEVEKLIQALEAATPTPPAAPAETGALIDYLLERYHETHRRQFPEAIRLAARVEAAHRDHPDCPTGLSQHLAFMFDDLESHHQKEEMALFPMMRQGAAPRVWSDRLHGERAPGRDRAAQGLGPLDRRLRPARRDLQHLAGALRPVP